MHILVVFQSLLPFCSLKPQHVAALSSTNTSSCFPSSYLFFTSSLHSSHSSQDLVCDRECSINMDRLERVLSRPVAKPYRSKGIKDQGRPYLNDKGLLDFSPDDIESKDYGNGYRRPPFANAITQIRRIGRALEDGILQSYLCCSWSTPRSPLAAHQDAFQV